MVSLYSVLQACMQYELGYGTLVSIYVMPQWMDKNIIHTNAQPRFVYVHV